MNDPTRPADEDRLEDIMDVIVAMASNDFARRAWVGDGSALLDGIAGGLNMLAEEMDNQKQREALHGQRMQRAERLAALGQLAASVAHEVNNPATFVLMNLHSLSERLKQLEGFLQTLRAAPRDSSTLDIHEAQQALADAHAMVDDNLVGVERIVSMVKNLRHFARQEPVEQGALQLATVVEDACALVAHQVKFRARLQKRLKPTPPVHGDATRLTQVLTNLLVNAAQAIEEGNADSNPVEISLHREGGNAVLRVRDTGCGIAPHVKAHLFEPFFTTKPRNTGTGLGLSISRDIVAQHNGDLRLLSSDATGSVFEVRLPLTGVAMAVRSVTPASSSLPQMPRRRVLLVDDEEHLLLAFQRIFGRQYDFHTASGGKAAITLMAVDQEWDAVLCDLMMPDLDGAAVFAWAEAHAPALADRMAFVSGGAFTPSGAAFLDRMQGRVLMKPMSRDIVVATVERLFARR